RAAFQRYDEALGIEKWAAPGVDDERAVLHLLDVGTVEQVVGISGERRVERHDVAPPQQLAKRNVLGGCLGTTVMGQDSATKALQPVDHRGTDAACPDHPNGQVA